MCKKEYVNLQTGEKLDWNRVNQLPDNTILKVRPDLWCEWDFEKNDELGYDIWKMTKGSGKKAWWICKNCYLNIKNKKIKIAVSKGTKCNNCSDGKSIPEKIVYHILRILNEDFTWETSFEWSQRKRYDFFLNTYNTIIEVHGEQHYEDDCFDSIGGRTLEEEQENDRYKRELALQNGIEHYITLDFRDKKYDRVKFMLLNIEHELFNKISEDIIKKAFILAEKSIFLETCELYSLGEKSISNISKILKIGRTTVNRYLLKGNELGLIEYDPNNGHKLGGVKRCKKVVQLDIDFKHIKTWSSVKEASIGVGIKNSAQISSACKSQNLTVKGFRWCYEEDYFKVNELKDIFKNEKTKQVVMILSTYDTIKFKSISEALTFIGKDNKSAIANCCRGLTKTSYGYRWMYKEDYDKYIEEQNQAC